jgi:hypothetical protein
MNFLKKYWMPKSLTWWIGMFMIISGVILNIAALFGYSDTAIVVAINFIWQTIPSDLTGIPTGSTDIPPNLLVAGGMALIGLRRATGAAGGR